MSHGSRRRTDRLLEMGTALLTLMLGIGLAGSTTAPVAVVILGWALIVGGAIWVEAVHTRR